MPFRPEESDSAFGAEESDSAFGVEEFDSAFGAEEFDSAFGAGAASAEPFFFSGLEVDFAALFFSSAILNFPKFERIKKIRKQPLSTPIFPADRVASTNPVKLD